MSGPAAPPPPPYAGGPPAPPNAAGPPPVPGPWTRWGEAATFGQRAEATLWDWLLTLPGLVLMLVSAGLFGVSVVQLAEGDGGGAWLAATGVVFVLGLALMIGVQVWNYALVQGRTGQTWGKRRVGIRLVSLETGRPPGTAACVGRWLLHALINQALYIDYLWCALQPDRATITDKVLSTAVLAPTSRPEPRPVGQNSGR
ncbi:RDD family protein [Nocardioides sp. SYSU D00038]|uniref:RDD family protein n=1 Tax=Nocardioides sp. SYSU D00038 TaxID=2812554 RepID=UPI001966ECD1|nr:RDD family protein [Nocardioides sp. SYSU D00038]